MDEAIERLSPRQREVLALLLEGLEVSEVGRQLQLSPFAVRTQLQSAAVKLWMATKDEDEVEG